MNFKIKAGGIHPEQKNLKVDFSAEESTKDEAVELIKKKIDHYLHENDLTAFSNNTQ